MIINVLIINNYFNFLKTKVYSEINFYKLKAIKY